MKTLITIVLFFPLIASAQYFVTDRSPIARAEAMGRAYVSLDGDLNSVYFNPAGIATINCLQFEAGYVEPLTNRRVDEYNDFIAVGYRFNHYITVAASRNHIYYGEILDPYGFSTNTTKEYGNNYSLTLASEPVRDFLIGLNINHYFLSPGTIFKSNATYADIGLIKKFVFGVSDFSANSVSIGANINNVSGSAKSYSVHGLESTSNIPSLLTFGLNYNFKVMRSTGKDSLHNFECIFEAEGAKYLYEKYMDDVFVHLGAEFLIYEIICLRAGYYSENDGVFTYGFGLQLPLYKLTKTPLNLAIDYTTLPLEYGYYVESSKNFHLFNLKLDWRLR